MAEKRTRRAFSPEQKAAIVRRHLKDVADCVPGTPPRNSVLRHHRAREGMSCLDGFARLVRARIDVELGAELTKPAAARRSARRSCYHPHNLMG